MNESGEQTPSGLARWLTVHDDLLRGLVHSFSNRVGAIATTAYLLELQPGSPTGPTATLREECDRLDALLHLLRLLPHRGDAPAEPVIPTDAVAQAMALQHEHPEHRETSMTVTRDGDLQPAYVEPGAFTMALAVAIGAARRAAHAGGEVAITIGCTTDRVTIWARGVRADHFPGDADPRAQDDLAAVEWLLAPSGGRALADRAGVGLAVPTLQAARRH
ncbi:MAG: hypothetical protein WCK74_09785 [Gemmatimonadaceae bacterium]